MASTPQTDITTLLSSLLKSNQDINNLPPAVKNLLTQSIDSQVQSFSGKFINTIDAESNFQLNDIPKKTIGPNNPVDIVSSNLNSNQLTNNLLPNVQDKTQPQLSAALVNNIFDNFKNQLSPIKTKGINLDNIFSSLSSSATNAVGQGLNAVLGNFSKNLLNGQVGIPPILEQVDDLFSSNPGGALEQIDQ